ncbi:AIG2-like family-domain-containing protein [Xylaria digitata]|nr:AIG2-like family-domain-containing protein [Xylaria digitata]
MGHSQDRTHAAFFYGTLMAPEVFFTVCYRSSTDDIAVLKSLHQFQPAILHEYCRRRVKFADYPGITPDPNHEVRGVYVTGLTDANMYHLDQFEGSEYERKTVKARLLSKVGDDKGNGNVEGEEVECEVYVFNNPTELEDREWDFEEFRTQKMKKWTREDYGFDNSDHFAPQPASGDEKVAACQPSSTLFSLKGIMTQETTTETR